MKRKTWKILSTGILISTGLITGCSLLSSSEELKIEKGTPFAETQFPKAQDKPGPILDPVPKDWKEASLNGIWKCKELPFKEDKSNPLDDKGMKDGFFKADYNDGSWSNKIVPWSWYLSQPNEKKSQDKRIGKFGWYRHSFEISKSQLKPRKRIVLDFNRVSNQVDLWVNGEKAGKRQTGRFNSIQYDITSFLKPGKNTIAVRIYDWMGHTSYRRRNIGGIYGPVRLITTSAPVFSTKMMLTPIMKEKAVGIQAEIENETGKAQSMKLTAEIANWKDGKIAARKDLGKIEIQKGQKIYDLGKIKLEKPINWSLENPHLYTLTIKDEKGNSVGMERFGFREFKAIGEWLYLNGKKFKPRMHTFTLWKKPSLIENKNSEMEKLIRMFKELGVNMIRPHSGMGMLPETFYNLCDEIGMLVYSDWAGLYYIKDFSKAEKGNTMEAWKPLSNFIEDYYSHPSFCMLSFQNEIYEGQAGWFSKKLDKLYELTKKLDKQNRPVCTSTGRQTLEAMKAKLLKERTGILDDHQYRGSYCGSWQENIKHIEDYAKEAKKYYGKKPKIDAEYGVPGDTVRYRPVTFSKLWPAFQLDPSSREFKEKYIEFLKSPAPEIGGYIRLKMNYASPRQYLDEKTLRERNAQFYFKRPVEIYRRAEEKCLGGHTNEQWYDVVRVGEGGNTLSFYGKSGPIPQEDKWFDMPLKEELKRVYNPTFVSAGVFNEHPMPGSEQKVEVFVTNDLNEDADFKVIPQLRLNGKVEKLSTLDFGKIKGMEQESKTLRYKVPEVKGRQRGQLELFLFKDGKKVGDNYYPVTIIDNTGKINADKKVALYDVGGKMFRGLGSASTSTVLKELGLKAEAINDFKNLKDYKYLIIGVNSFDKNLIDSSEEIYKWLKNGGKILCFEQSLCGKVPFLPNYSITAGSPSVFVSMSALNHPIFKNLKQEDFDSWAGDNGTMYDFAISPLDVGLVAVATTGAFRDTDSVRSVINDAKVGKGEIILSQASATKRVKNDSVARAYLKNLLEYFLEDNVPKYALTLPEKDFSKVVYVEDKDALPIDISKFANRGFLDSTAGDKKGGWADFGVGFEGIPTGTSRLQGGVPFKIINPASNNGKSCIVMKGNKRPWLPEKITGIPVNAKLNSVYFLHTAMYSKKGPVLKYVFHYADGKTCEFTATNEREIPDWWKPKDRSNALVVFRNGKKGLYMSEFVNPMPKNEIKSMDIISCNGSIPIIVGITGRKRFTSTIAGVGEK